MSDLEQPKLCGWYIGSECPTSRDGTHRCDIMGEHDRHRCGCGYWATEGPARPATMFEVPGFSLDGDPPTPDPRTAPTGGGSTGLDEAIEAAAWALIESTGALWCTPSPETRKHAAAAVRAAAPLIEREARRDELNKAANVAFDRSVFARDITEESRWYFIGRWLRARAAAVGGQEEES